MDGGLMEQLPQVDNPVAGSTRGPWTAGYTSSVPEFMASPENFIGQQDGTDTYSSRDVVVDPYTGGIQPRAGCTIVNDDVSAAGQSPDREDIGLLPEKWSAKAMKMFAIDSPSLANGYPTFSVLYGNETDRKGTIYLGSTNDGLSTNALKNYTLLEEYADGVTYSNDPATDTGSSKYRLKVVPTFVDSGAGLYNRGVTAQHRQYLTSGSRGVLMNQNWLYAPNLYGNPWRWNKRFNESSSIGSETVRIHPTGPWPPLWCPTLATLPASAASDAPWVDGDTFFLSVLFQFEDGSYSAPCIPRLPNSTLTNGFGYIVVGTPHSSPVKYAYIDYENIPIGPEGTVKRVLLRTTKQNRTSTSDRVTLSPLDLRIITVIDNNTQTTFRDYNGDDNSLVEDADVVRIDRVLPRRARYIGTGDQRAIISYTLQNQSAIMLAPVGATANYDLNVADANDSAYTARAHYFKLVSDEQFSGATRRFSLRLVNAKASETSTIGSNTREIVITSTSTLQGLVDTINATSVTAGSGGPLNYLPQWRAQLAPGVDGSALAYYVLSPTTYGFGDYVTTDATTTLTTAGSFANVPVGAYIESRVRSGGATVQGNIPLGTYVVSKESDTSLTMSQAATGSSATDVVSFYSETGDNGYVTYDTDTSTATIAFGGYIRAFCGAFPGVLYTVPFGSWTSKYATASASVAARATQVADKTSVYFTTASPGDADSGISLAPNSWVAGNRRMPHSSPHPVKQRMVMGIVDLEGAALVAYSDGIHMLMNVRGSNTGEDDDIRLFTVNDTRGCVSFRGLVSGNGWAAYATEDGILATDKNRREFKLSGNIFNRSMRAGDLVYELERSAKAAAADTDDQYLVLSVVGGKLALACRKSSGLFSHVLYYDFSPGIEANGIEEVISPEDRKTYAWSAPCRYNGLMPTAQPIAAFASVSGSTLKHYIALDSNQGTTGDGHIEQIETTFKDNNYDYNAKAIFPPFMATEFSMLKPHFIEVTHLTKFGSGNLTALLFANDQTPSFNSSLIRKLPVDTASKSRVHKQVVPIDTQQRGPTDLFWVQWRQLMTTDTGANKIWRISLRYTETRNPNSRITGL